MKQYLIKLYNLKTRAHDAILVEAMSEGAAHAIALCKLFNPEDIFGGWGFNYQIIEIIEMGKAA